MPATVTVRNKTALNVRTLLVEARIKENALGVTKTSHSNTATDAACAIQIQPDTKMTTL